jgi:thiol-disulfide isomerase/thioredoxin
MRSCLIFAFALLTAAFGFSQDVSKPVDVPVVTVEPGCPEWRMPATRGQPMIPPHITILYNPQAPGARLTSVQSITLVLASARGIRFDSTTIPMTRAAAGTWEADFAPKRNYVPGYSIFFFEDERNRADNNGGQYWDILNCSKGEPDEWAVNARAATYQGRLLAPGIERAPDLTRALDILKNDLRRHPDHYSHYFSIWRYELELGSENPSAYEQVGGEVDAFISARGNDPYALRQISGFIGPEQQKLPPSVVNRFRQAVTALPQTAEPIQIESGTGKIYHVPRDERFLTRMQREVSDILGELDYWSVSLEQMGWQKMAEDYLAFAAEYPDSFHASQAYGSAFDCEKELNDVAGAETVFEKWAALDPESPHPLLAMAQFYIAQNTRVDRAVKLLDTAATLYLKNQAPSVTRHFSEEPGKLEFLLGQAYALLNDLPAARNDLEAAATAAPDNPDVLYALGEVREKMGNSAQALEAYLAAASAPYQESPAPREAYERLFLTQKLGTNQDAEQRILAQVGENAHRTAAQYTPVAINRPAPKFAFADLVGKRFDNQAAKGKPTVLTFWSIWCAPCVAELPALQEFQKQHPSANLLALAVGNKPEEVKSFLSTRNLNTLRVALSDKWPQEFGASAFPTTIVMDRFGQIQFVHVGQLADVGAILGKDLDALPEFK